MKNGFYDLLGSDVHRFMILKEAIYKQKLPQIGHEQVFKTNL